MFAKHQSFDMKSNEGLWTCSKQLVRFCKMLLFDRIYRGASDKVEFTGKLPSKACCLLEVTCTDSRYNDFEGKNSIRHAH